MYAARHPGRVVVAGGGVAGLETLVALRRHAGGAVDLHLVCPDEAFSLRALGIYTAFGGDAPQVYDIAEIAARLGATLHHDAVRRVRAERHAVELQSGAELDYGALVLAVGAFAHPAFDHGVCFDPARAAVERVVAELPTPAGGRVAVVVPPAVAWTLPAYELALAAAAQAPHAHITLVTHEAAPLGAFGPAASAMVRAELAAAGVDLVAGVAAHVPADDTVAVGPSVRLRADHILHLPALTGPRLHGVPADGDGFIAVDEEFRAGHEDVFAIGDATNRELKQGGLAAEQADAVAAMLASRAGAEAPPESYQPVLRGLLYTPSGPRYLRAADGDCLISDQPLWWPPSKVAARELVPWLATADLERAVR